MGWSGQQQENNEEVGCTSYGGVRGDQKEKRQVNKMLLWSSQSELREQGYKNMAVQRVSNDKHISEQHEVKTENAGNAQ